MKKPKLAKEHRLPRLKRPRRLVRVPYLLVLVLLTAGILSIDLLPRQVSLAEGEIAGEDIYYEGATTSYTSALRTDEAKNQAAEAVEDIYYTDETVTDNLLAAIDGYAETLDAAALALQEGGDESAVLSSLREGLPAGDYGDGILNTMLSASSATRSQQFATFKALLREVYAAGVHSEQVEEARTTIALAIDASPLTGDAETFFKNLLAAMELPFNTTKDAVATREAEDAAMEAVTPVQVTVRSGEKLVSRGSVVTAEQVEALQALGLHNEYSVLTPYLGLLLLAAVVLTLLFLYLRLYQPQVYGKTSSMLLFGVVFILFLLLCKLISLISFSDSSEVSLLIGYLLPVPAASLLLAVLLNRKTAIFVTLCLSVFVGVIMDGSLAYSVVAMAGGAAAVITAAHLNQRSQFVGASMWITLANLLLICALGMLWRSSYSAIAVGALFGLINGLLSAILAMGILPFLESAFHVTTVIRLLELSNSNHPLLKRMMTEAPGSYNHSILVGNLAEAAADAIGADALLVRVASYYHDIGKLKRPHFYIENQRPGENPHDKLQPALSAMIITSHVTDGIKMLREARFPEEIIDIVEQHHGNSLVSFFYHKAKEAALDPDAIKEEDYRYKGRRPQTKEAALVMLADSVQAAIQALQSGDPQAIENRVREVINGKIASDQLADCPLTFRDLEAVVQSFLTVIAGMNHHRISYPDEAKALNTAIAAELGAPAPVLPAATAQPAEKEAE